MTLAKWMTALALMAILAAVSGLAPGAAPDGGTCEQSEFPDCFGICDARGGCKADPNGFCTCSSGDVSCGDSEFPICDGACAAGEICSDEGGRAIACSCIPGTVDCGRSFPACNGDCLLGEMCIGNVRGDACICDPGELECGQGDPAICDGTCPTPSQECKLPPGATLCECVDPFLSCEQSDPATCGGECPNPEDICIADAAGTTCRCEPPPPVLCEESGFPVCDGDCRPDSACASDAATDKCFCLPFPCEQSDPATCGGECPPGSTCESDGAGGACQCIEIGRPCTQCGPGPHFIDACGPFPPVGTDLIASSGAVVGIDLDFDCLRDTNLVLVPCPPPHNLLQIDKTFGPIDDSVNFPNTSPVDGHPTGPGLDVIDTEIVSMCLTNGAVTLIAGAAGPSALPLQQSLGTVAEDLTTPDPTMADSFFDVFFEVTGVPGGPVYNRDPLRVKSRIECLPPAANYQHPEGMCIPLTTSGSCEDSGVSCVSDTDCAPAQCLGTTLVANLVSANHSVNQPVCSETTFPDCLGDCAAGDKCEADNANGICVCASEVVPCGDSLVPVCDGVCPPASHCETVESDVVILPSPDLPPDSDPVDCDSIVSQYVGADVHARFPNGIDFSNPIHKCFRNVQRTIDPLTGDETEVFESTLEGHASIDGGPAEPVSLSGPVKVITRGKGGQATGSWDTEMLSMELTGTVDTVLVEIRESPGLLSVGRTTVRDNGDGTIVIDSFFDVFIELSLDGGQFQPQTNGAGRMVLMQVDPRVCECVPDAVPCEDSDVATCGGDCQSGEECVPDGAGQKCVCQPLPVPCEESGFPVCDGVCPPDSVCASDTATEKCLCKSLLCDQSDPATCGGECPNPDDLCLADATGTACRCQPVFPPEGTDLSPTVGIFRMEVLGVGEVDAKVHGETLLAWQNPQHDPATGKHTTQTEMLSMDLSGFHPSIGNMVVRAGVDFGLPPTLGTVVPLDLSGDFPALATFDVFFEVEIVGVATMRNSDPLIMQQVINEIPPRNTGLRNTLPVLFTDVLDPTSVHKLDIGFHWMCPPPFPPPGVPCPVPCSINPFPVCGFGDCPVNEECVPNDASGICTCQPLPIPCDESGFPVCDGACPSDSTCVSDKFSDICRCEVVSCENSDPDTCGGSCPNAGDVCTTNAAGTECKCEPPPVRCEDSDKATCDGECANPDEVCTADPTGGPCKCLPPIPADCSGDGDVDLEDAAIFIDCIRGPGLPLPSRCECTDYDGDGDADLDDARILQNCFSGDGVLGDPNCGN